MNDKHLVLYQIARYDYTKPNSRTVIAELYGRREATALRDSHAAKNPEYGWKVERA